MPVPGNGSYDWADEYIPFDELPRSWNPSKGYFASANNRATPPSYIHHIAHDWDAGQTGYRAKRITEYILEHSTGGEEDPVWIKRLDMQHLQQDTVSLMAKDFIAQVLLRIPSDRLSDNGKHWQTMLATWDYDTVTGSVNATIFERWLVYLPSQ
jgi:penicillin amidase